MISLTSNPFSVVQTPLKLQLDAVVRNLKTDHEIWKSCHSSGCRIVVDIAKEYGKCLTIIKKENKLKTSRAPRNGRFALHRCRRLLKEPTEHLVRLVDRLLEITEHTRQSVETLRRMCNDAPPQNMYSYYRNWQLRDILEFAEDVMPLYDAEYETKKKVMEEITNSKNHEELLDKRDAWREPRHVLTERFTELFKEFDFETREIKID